MGHRLCRSMAIGPYCLLRFGPQRLEHPGEVLFHLPEEPQDDNVLVGDFLLGKYSQNHPHRNVDTGGGQVRGTLLRHVRQRGL